MAEWEFEKTERFASRARKMAKKHRKAVAAAFANLEKYQAALKSGCKPTDIKDGFLHPEGRGIVAIDQSDGGDNLPEIRLYIYLRDSTIYLLTIGDKQDQQNDIKEAHKEAKALKRTG